MKFTNLRRAAIASVALLGLIIWSANAAADSTQQFVGDIERAIKARDDKALLARADLSKASALNAWFLIKLIDDCNDGVACAVTVKLLDDAWRKEDAAIRERQKTEWRAPPEGTLRFAGKSDAKPGAKVGEVGAARTVEIELPYARIGDQYRIVVAALLPAERTRLLATSASAAAEATLEKSSDFAGLDISSKAWKVKAKPLSADGGNPGAAYLAYVGKIAAAITAKDVDALTAATGDVGQFLFGAKDYAGKPVPLDKRQRKMRAQSVRMEVEAKVQGGYVLDSDALLIVEGRNGFGNVVRGAAQMKLKNGVWVHGGSDLMEIPAG